VNAHAFELDEVIGGKYRLVRTLGAGGMGIVYEARHELTGKRVAIKRLRPELAARPAHAQRMLREARASAQIRHPNVVDVLDVGSDRDAFFLVMEYLEGETLRARLARGALSVAEALALLMPPMRGVAAGHALGIVHRDIKPENIFLTQVPDCTTPVLKVLDFGISKLMHDDDLSLTESGTTMGTPLYMSYEQLTSAGAVDVRADVYAFAVILYEILTGRTPYRAESLGSLAVQLATTRPRRASDLNPRVPLELDAVLAYALESDRDARCPSLGSFMQRLAPFATGIDSASRVCSVPIRSVDMETSPVLRAPPPQVRRTESMQVNQPNAGTLSRQGKRAFYALAVLSTVIGAGLFSASRGPAPRTPGATHAGPARVQAAVHTELPRAAPPADRAPDAGASPPEESLVARPRKAPTRRVASEPRDTPRAPLPEEPTQTRDEPLYRAGKPRLEEF
jgi:serine/threonine-protein kinase